MTKQPDSIEEAKQDNNYKVVEANSIEELQVEVNKLTNSKKGYRPVGTIKQLNNDKYIQILFREDGMNEGNKQLLHG